MQHLLVFQIYLLGRGLMYEKQKRRTLRKRMRRYKSEKERSGYEIFSDGAVTPDGVCSKESMRAASIETS